LMCFKETKLIKKAEGAIDK